MLSRARPRRQPPTASSIARATGSAPARPPAARREVPPPCRRRRRRRSRRARLSTMLMTSRDRSHASRVAASTAPGRQDDGVHRRQSGEADQRTFVLDVGDQRAGRVGERRPHDDRRAPGPAGGQRARMDDLRAEPRQFVHRLVADARAGCGRPGRGAGSATATPSTSVKISTRHAPRATPTATPDVSLPPRPSVVKSSVARRHGLAARDHGDRARPPAGRGAASCRCARRSPRGGAPSV